MERLLFHVADCEARESIRQNGIDFRRVTLHSQGQEEQPGNYVWDTLTDAFSFACYQLDMDGIETDIWTIRAESLDLIADPYYEGLLSVEEIESLQGSAWVCAEPIARERLELTHPATVEATA